MFLQLRVADRCHQFAGGIKALAALGLSVGLALAEYYDTVPLQPILTQVFGEGAAAKICLFLPVVFGTLRYVSTNQVKWHHEDEHHGEPF